MHGIPELAPEIRHFAKTILVAKTDPMYDIIIEWFKAGAWYMDAISGLVLILPEDDPTLTQILDSMRSGTLYENEVIAKNILRFGMAVDESAAFIVANSKAESLLLHARALVQNSPRQSSAKPSATNFYTTVFKAKVGSSLFARGSLTNRWRAALDDPLWWLALGAIGAMIFL